MKGITYPELAEQLKVPGDRLYKFIQRMDKEVDTTTPLPQDVVKEVAKSYAKPRKGRDPETVEAANRLLGQAFIQINVNSPQEYKSPPAPPPPRPINEGKRPKRKMDSVKQKVVLPPAPVIFRNIGAAIAIFAQAFVYNHASTTTLSTVEFPPFVPYIMGILIGSMGFWFAIFYKEENAGKYSDDKKRVRDTQNAWLWAIFIFQLCIMYSILGKTAQWDGAELVGQIAIGISFPGAVLGYSYLAKKSLQKTTSDEN